MAGKNRFIVDKVIWDGTITPIVSTDYHPSHPAYKVQNIWTDYYYRSKYGANSGWGYFEITAANNKLYFNDGSARIATITIGDYDGDSLAIEMKTQMDAVGGQTYAVSYSDTSRKFIISASSNFTLSCTNTTNAIWVTIGYDTGSDKTGTNSYISDYVRIHTYAALEIVCPGAASTSTTACAIYGLNLTSSYQILKLQRWTGSIWTDVGNFTYDSANGRAILMYSSIEGTKYRIVIRDWTNILGYVQVGAVVLGDYSEISTWFDYGFGEDIEDTSQHQYSKEGYLNVIVGFFRDLKGVTYKVMSADEAKLEAVYLAAGKRYPFVFVQDSDDAINTMEYGIFRTKFGRRGEDSYTKEITLAWESVK